MDSAKSGSDPMALLGEAIRSNDAERVHGLLRAHPGLAARLDEALPEEGFGATPLLVAVQQRNRETAEALLAAGADINVRSHWWAGGFGVLDGDSGMEEWLIARGARLTAHAAARLGRLDRLQELLETDPELVHARGGDGQAPLHFAATVEVAELLLTHGAAIDALDLDHESTPAQWMVQDRGSVARYLVERGCRTDLLLVTALGDLTRVEAHLAADPGSIRMRVADRWFPRRDPRSAGTIYKWTLDSDKTAHWVARKFGHTQILAFLMARTPEPLQLVLACGFGDAARVRELLARHPGLVNQLGPEDLQELPDAARDRNLAAVRLMLDAGWPVNVAGHHHGETALHWAGFHGNAEMVREILRHGPDLTVRSREFDGTALDWASYGSQHGWHPERGDYESVIEQLKSVGTRG